MKKRMKIFVVMLLLFSFSFGCASTSSETRIKCPKCGAFFSTKEGAETYEWMRGPGATRK
jgi:hypothetical protein